MHLIKRVRINRQKILPFFRGFTFSHERRRTPAAATYLCQWGSILFMVYVKVLQGISASLRMEFHNH
jgi:hypothetical protein